MLRSWFANNVLWEILCWNDGSYLPAGADTRVNLFTFVVINKLIIRNADSTKIKFYNRAADNKDGKNEPGVESEGNQHY